jgi:hypothetical protein
MARQCQGLARQAPDPAAAKRFMKMALKAGRHAAQYLRPGGELRETAPDWVKMKNPRRPSVQRVKEAFS